MSSTYNIQFPAIFQENIGGTEIQTVNARDIHEFLQVGKMFAHWIKDRIEQYGFIENQDYIMLAENGKLENKGFQGKIEYHVSLDMAKELSMVARGERGKMIRKYFLECEKKAKSLDPIQILNDPSAMRGLLLSYSEKVIALESKVEEAKPKVDFYDQYLNADGLYGLQNAARALHCRPNLFIRWLKETYLFYQGDNLVAKVQYTQSGLFEVKTTIVDDKARPQAFITPKGLKYLDERVPDEIRLKSVA